MISVLVRNTFSHWEIFSYAENVSRCCILHTSFFSKKSVGFDLDKKAEKDVCSMMMIRGLPYAMFPKRCYSNPFQIAIKNIDWLPTSFDQRYATSAVSWMPLGMHCSSLSRFSHHQKSCSVGTFAMKVMDLGPGESFARSLKRCSLHSRYRSTSQSPYLDCRRSENKMAVTSE